MIQVTIPNQWKPRWYQAPALRWFDNGGRFAIWVHHRRAGKDLSALHQTCKMMHRRVGAYWHVFPTESQGRKALWTEFTRDGQRIMEQVFPRAVRKSPREFYPKAEMVVELKNGSIWRLLGSDKMDVVGAGPVGCVFSEYALAKPNTWDLVRPMLRERDGWAWFISTPRGKNHFWKLLQMAKDNPSWHVDLKRLDETLAYDPVRTVEEERASGMPEELIQQEYFIDFSAANVGSFYGVTLSALQARGGLEPFDSPKDDVFTTWDLGRSDDTAIWWWRPNAAGAVDVLDHYASHGEDLEHYFQVLEQRQRHHGWRYRKHYFPHDARAKTLAARQSVMEQAVARLGAGLVDITPNLALFDGIDALRRLLLDVGTRIHPCCSLVVHNKDCDGVEALRAYHREWDAERKCFRGTPVHDWSSHTADAARYMAVAHKLAQALCQRSPAVAPVVPKPYNQVLRGDDMVPVRYSNNGRIG